MPLQVLQVQNLPATGVALLTQAGNAVPATIAQAPGLPQAPAPLQGNIFIDPANSTGVASDGNPGTSALPLKSWAGLIGLWGTFSPFLTQATTITFLSSHVDNTDPVIFAPYIGRGVAVAIKGSVVTVTAGVVLAGTVAKSRAAGANSLLQTNLGATGAVIQRVVNTTHASVAWAYKALGGNAFSMFQPFVASTLGGTLSPAEVDTWANADVVNLTTLTAVNIASIAPTVLDSAGSFSLFQLTIFDPAGAGSSICELNATSGTIAIQECSSQRVIQPYGGSKTSVSSINSVFQAIQAGTGLMQFLGGGHLAQSAIQYANIAFDGDYISGAQLTLINSDINQGFLFLDGIFQVQGGLHVAASLFYGGHVVYGSAGNLISLSNNARLVNAVGTFVASFTAPQIVTAFQLNGATNAVSHTNAQPDVLNGNITTSPANLDAAAGATGFGGNAVRWAGASIGNA